MAQKKSMYHVIIDQITGIFFPIINIITAASIMKSLVVLLASFGVISSDGGLYQVFFAVGDGFFYFLPFFLAFTASKQWKTDPFISILIPVTMLYPGLTAILENGQDLSFLNIFTMNASTYHSSVLPVIMAVGLLHFVEKPCDKYIPEIVRGFLKPICCCIIVLPLTFLVFGPLGGVIGGFLTNIFFNLYNWNPIVAGAFMGFFIQPMVVVGAHWSIVPVCINNIMESGFDIILPLLGGAVYGQAGASLAVAILYKDKKKKSIAYQAAFTSFIGTTEPSLFGVNVPLVRPMIAACFAGAFGGAMVGAVGTQCNAFAFPSFLTCIAYIGPGFAVFLLSMVVGFILGFLFTIIQKKQIRRIMEEQEKKETE